MRHRAAAFLAVSTMALAGALTTTTGAWAGADHDPVAAARAALAKNPKAARAVDGQGFVAGSVVVDRDGDRHVRLDRTYRGLPVIGGDLVAHLDADDSLEGVSQTLGQGLSLAVTPQMSPTGAEKVAVDRLPARMTKKVFRDSQRLVIDATGKQPRLAWQVVTGGRQSDGTPSRLISRIDALTGAVLGTEETIHTVDGEGNTLYSGKVPLQVTQSGSTYQLKDPTRGNSYTTDMKGSSDSFFCTAFKLFCSNGSLITSPTTVFGNGTTSDRLSVAADAQYGSNVTWDYFLNTHGRRGIWDNGTGSFNRVHYGNRFVNAFWDGKKMTYGDGDGVNYGPLVSLDVAAHEMSHGVTQNSANLVYKGESGGLNEATSDIFGALVEFYANNPNDPGDYYVGEEFDLVANQGFRRMDKPSSDGSSLDCWSSTAGQKDVHYSSGIGNHFFYLLAEGSGAKVINGRPHESSTCNGSTVSGIGREAAGKIWYRALTVYMTSNTNYAGARVATIKAANDLFGANSTESAAVARAWSAVSVN